MHDPDDFLLGLYRDAREQPPARFQEALLDRLQKRFDFSAAFWCDARVGDATTLVPTGLRLRNVDPAFLLDWTELHPLDPAVPMALANPGNAFRVHVPTFYSRVPHLAELLRRYDIQSMTVLLVPGARAPAIQAIALYRREAGAFCSDVEKRWLESAMPHLGEALRINAAVHAPAGDPLALDGAAVALAEAESGRLMRADARFLALASREWSGFDGRRLPPGVVRGWRAMPAFVHFGRRIRIECRRSGALVYLTARENLSEALTPRQLEVAMLYAEGLSSKQIAQRCNLAPATVRTHLAAVYAVFGVHGKIEMAHRLRQLLDRGGGRPPLLPAER